MYLIFRLVTNPIQDRRSRPALSYILYPFNP